MRPALPILIMAAGASCTGEIQPLGIGEPMRITNGAFLEGTLPEGGLSRVTAIDSGGSIATPGQLRRSILGRATEDAYSIGVRFAELGSGWWVIPTGAIDPSTSGERDFILDLSLGPVPPGIHRLRIVAIDGAGQGGPPSELPICVLDPARPDDLSLCSDTIIPPAAVIVLSWDTGVDLDLVLRTPDHKIVDARHPTTALAGMDGVPAEALADPTIGVFTQDSNAECRIDGRNIESIVWREAPAAQTFLAYANLYEACGQRSVRFVMAIYRRQNVGGKEQLVETDRRSGVMGSAAANGGAGPPLYVTALSFE